MIPQPRLKILIQGSLFLQNIFINLIKDIFSPSKYNK
jgi:hypothetical protein